MLKFFTHGREASGMAYLKLSAQKSYLEACYVYGIILYPTSLEDAGVKFLKICENKISLLEEDFGGRRNCKSVVKNSCKKKVKRIRWDGNDGDDYYGEHACEACKWNEENREL
ncbi:hypothetical protein SDJN02_05950, partial [Cucurbita argyrosperma subsp. argyrosperma]